MEWIFHRQGDQIFDWISLAVEPLKPFAIRRHREVLETPLVDPVIPFQTPGLTCEPECQQQSVQSFCMGPPEFLIGIRKKRLASVRIDTEKQATELPVPSCLDVASGSLRQRSGSPRNHFAAGRNAG